MAGREPSGGTYPPGQVAQELYKATKQLMRVPRVATNLETSGLQPVYRAHGLTVPEYEHSESCRQTTR
jgi:hypothetical protein